MTRLIRTILLWTLILSACSPGMFFPEASSPTHVDTQTSIPSPTSTTESPTLEIIPSSTTEVLPPPKLVATLSTPHIDQGPDGAATIDPSYPRPCGYQWAYKDLPELSGEFQQSIQALQPDAQASAFGFGEDCLYADGTRTFIPMETDFNIILSVSDLSDGALGEWIVKIMQVIDNIPPDQIIGPRPGRVGIRFEANADRKDVSFYIDQYRGLPGGLSPQEIFQSLQPPQ